MYWIILTNICPSVFYLWLLQLIWHSWNHSGGSMSQCFTFSFFTFLLVMLSNPAQNSILYLFISTLLLLLMMLSEVLIKSRPSPMLVLALPFWRNGMGVLYPWGVNFDEKIMKTLQRIGGSREEDIAMRLKVCASTLIYKVNLSLLEDRTIPATVHWNLKIW